MENFTVVPGNVLLVKMVKSLVKYCCHDLNQPHKKAIYQLCQSMPRTGQEQAGTSRDKQGQTETSRDKQGHFLSVPACPCLSLSVHACPFLSLSVPVCPCLALSVPVCPCLSLYVSTFDVPSCLPLQMNIKVFISLNIVTSTFLAKGTFLMHANLVFNFFFTLHLASSITLSFNPNSSSLVINIKEASTWFLSIFFFYIVN